MASWDELTGQDQAVATLRTAAEAALSADGGAAMSHAWLLTGPPGSGRSNLAFAFATALLGGDRDPNVAQQVRARSHPDLEVLTTSGVIIPIEAARKAVKRSYYAPSVSPYRVIVVEDADRMSEHSSNTMLKAIEEPPERTVWILCAPSEADLLPTIRSRARSLRLTVPSAADVAALLVRRDGVDPQLAERAAREAQSHVGMAHRLATDEEARRRRAHTLDLALGIRSVSDAMTTAAAYHDIANEDGKAMNEERDARERAAALRSLGVEPGGTVPPKLRGALRELEEEQKRRSRRGLRDGLDRILVDLLSLYRDVLLRQLGAPAELVNEALRERIEDVAQRTAPAATLAVLDGIAEARTRIEANVAPLLALESMLITLAIGAPAPR